MTIDEQQPRSGGISAQRRLAQTRAELAELMLPPEIVARERARHAFSSAALAQQAERDAEVADWIADSAVPPRATRTTTRPAATTPRSARAAAYPAFAWAPLLRHGASIWWRHHPAHAAFEVANSALSHVAVRKPFLMLGVSAGAGALLMLLRPWRLVSVAGLALALLKMTDVRSVFGSLLRGE